MLIEYIEKKKESYLHESLWEQRKGVFNEPPKRIPCSDYVDAPLLGNGDVGVTIGGGADEQTFYIGKNDFWVQAHVGETWEQRLDRLLTDTGRRTSTRIIPVGQVILSIPQLKDASYYQEQDILHSEVRGSFTKDTIKVTTRSWVCAVKNLLITELTYENKSEDRSKDLEITIKHHAGEGEAREVFNYENDVESDLMWFKYKANSTNVAETRRVSVATRIIGKEAVYNNRFQTCNAVLKLLPGENVILTTSIVSTLDQSNYHENSLEMVRSLDQISLKELLHSHKEWWRSFWQVSYIDIGDPVLEKYYYGSNYILACCMREGKVPPGLFGNWVTTDRPSWTGSYTLNYNYEAPSWGLYAGNHADIAASYCDPLIEAIPLGKAFASEFLGCRGVYYPVELGPWGTICSMFFHDQKINAVFGAVNILMHFYHTYDFDYAKKVYPFLHEVAQFWEDYLVFEDGRYVICNDSIHERSKDRKNPIHSMGMVQMLFSGILDISKELGINSEYYDKWQHILDHFSPYPVFEKNGRKIFRFTEEGMEYGERNTVGTQHIYPAGTIGLDSEPELLKLAWDTVDIMQRWTDFNAFPTYYATAARVGYYPEIILEKLKEECINKALPNLAIHHGGGGIEDCNGVTSCVQEMLLQSYEGVLRLFPVWPENKNASFGTLRAVGAFLVSSEYKEGCVEYVLIQSEKGRNCTIVNPWQDKNVKLSRSTGKTEVLKGDRISFKTEANEKILLVPEGIK